MTRCSDLRCDFYGRFRPSRDDGWKFATRLNPTSRKLLQFTTKSSPTPPRSTTTDRRLWRRRLAWWRARQQQGFPVLVATEERRGQGICDVRRFSLLARLSIHGGRYHPHSRFRSWPGDRQGFAGGTDSSRHRPGQTYDDRRSGLREPGIHPIFTARRICAGRASARGRIQIRPIS